jgi:hypothetical protein
MRKTVISVGLSEASLTKALKELTHYKRDLEAKAKKLRHRIAEKMANYSRGGFAGAIVDDLLNGSPRQAEVNVSVTNSGDVTLVIADGEDAVWVEFGAGVYHNGSVGTSPHPSGNDLKFTIGTYGKGMGSRNVWGFYEDGELYLTHGTPAVMPMYNAVKTVCAEIDNIAREVFG